jgi:hypothetical protein
MTDTEALIAELRRKQDASDAAGVDVRRFHEQVANALEAATRGKSEAFRAGVKAQKNHARAMRSWALSDTSDPRPAFNDPYSGRAIQ